MPAMANASKPPQGQAGAACGRASWPFREEIKEIRHDPTGMNSCSPLKATPMAERLGVGGFDMGPLPVILAGIRHTRIQEKEGERPCGFFFMPEPFRYIKCRIMLPRCGALFSMVPRPRAPGTHPGGRTA